MAGRDDITRRDMLTLLSAMELAMLSIGLGMPVLARPIPGDPTFDEGAVHIRGDDGEDGVLVLEGEDSGDEIITLRA